jgi:hypothetical protein
VSSLPLPIERRNVSIKKGANQSNASFRQIIFMFTTMATTATSPSGKLVSAADILAAMADSDDSESDELDEPVGRGGARAVGGFPFFC